MAWTQERVDLLTKLWAEGLSASQIARTLGDVTRNAVIGKIHRLGLSGRATPARGERPRLASRRKATSRPVLVEPAVIEEAVLEDGNYATVLTLEDTMCKWPIGHPGSSEFHFCGRGTEEGTPYCDAHVRVAYQSMPTRRERDEQRKKRSGFEIRDLRRLAG